MERRHVAPVDTDEILEQLARREGFDSVEEFLEHNDAMTAMIMGILDDMERTSDVHHHVDIHEALDVAWQIEGAISEEMRLHVEECGLCQSLISVYDEDMKRGESDEQKEEGCS